MLPNPALIKSTIQAGIRRLRSDRVVTARLTADLIDRREEVEIRVDAPGVKEADVQVRYLTDAVLIRMDRFRAPRDGFDLAVAGRAVGFDGRVPLPENVDVDPEAANATLQANGTLSVRLPKVAEPADEAVMAAVDEP